MQKKVSAVVPSTKGRCCRESLETADFSVFSSRCQLFNDTEPTGSAAAVSSLNSVGISFSPLLF